ncbi:TlpA family protein disulfide reductase [Arsukibacterium indicum]|uniref:Thioredoxin family protein n=1 Tax=Arsukibacterium indicum TaxID=2848612 RepID=A0ABS6MNV1_9GAMM|nr:thioredoxin family protein [Arsukibacterium indicum]MBV2130503.1 thioredoxin family protein [Arsukibacterium indicum]
MRYYAVVTAAVLSAAIASLALTTAPAKANPHSMVQPATIGSISGEALLAQYPGFAAEYASYQPSAGALAQMQQLTGLQLLVLFGSWCHDSEREVPRLLKLVQQSGVALNTLQLETVNQQKQHPQQLHSQYNLRYTPTIIVLDNGRELGRIIEKPAKSLADDLAEIAAKR